MATEHIMVLYSVGGEQRYHRATRLKEAAMWAAKQNSEDDSFRVDGLVTASPVLQNDIEFFDTIMGQQLEVYNKAKEDEEKRQTKAKQKDLRKKRYDLYKSLEKEFKNNEILQNKT